MKTLNEWLAEYDEIHRNPTNQLIHKFCVPLILFSILGLLCCLPFPLKHSTWFQAAFYNWAALLLPFPLLFYFRLSFRATLPLLVVVLLMLLILGLWRVSGFGGMFPLSLGIFIFAWILQFIGHEIEGRRPAFFKDLQFLLIHVH